nr:uncharacterized protein LOC115264714 [Aedes albopictus]
MPKTPRTPQQNLSTPIAEQKVEKQKKEDLKKMDDQLRGLINQRAAVYGKVARVRAALWHSDDQPNPNIENIHFLQLHQKTVENCYHECNAIQNQIHALPLSEKRQQEETQSYIDFESLYNHVSIQLCTLIEAATEAKIKAAPPVGPPNAVVQPAIPIQPYLPPLQVPLPTFDGSYEKWYSFKAMFTTVMNRYQQEEPALKLFHLRNSLVGKAAGIIDQDLVNNNDYNAAWRVLTERYEDKRVVVDKHVENLFNLPKVGQENATNMRKMIDTCTRNVEALKHQNLPVDGLGEQMLVNLIAAKMDKKLRMSWEARQKKNVLSTYAATMDFLQEQCRICEKLDTTVKPLTESAKPKAAARSHTLVTSENKFEKLEQKCPLCKASHELWKCEAFKNKSVSEKYELLKKCGACFNCLARGHRTNACSSSHSCRECGKKHHTTLHGEDSSKKTSTSVITSQPTETSSTLATKADVNVSTNPVAGTSTTLCASTGNSTKHTLLSTAVVLVDGLCSTPYPCRVLLDSASQMNFVTERFANLLSLKTVPTDFTVSGLNGNKTRICRMLCTTIRSCHTDFVADMDLLVTPRITGDLPVTSFDVSEWPISAEQLLADPTFNHRGRVDMLIGAELFWKLLEDGQYELGPNLPILKNTKLGWIAGGTIATDTRVIARTFCQTADDEPLIELLKGFYKVEACDELRMPTKADDAKCLEHFQRTHQRNQEGSDNNSKVIVKTLGVVWNPTEDWFSVSVPDCENMDGITRRKLLSQLAKIFDPLGFFGPVITTAKLILREIGELQTDWDDPVPDEISSKWRNFRTEMLVLNDVRLPRWINWNAYLVRFVTYIMSKKKNVVKGLLTAEETQRATLVVVRLVQHETFQPEIRALKNGADTRNRLNGLKAFVDPEDGILRVGGRIKRAFIPYDSRHQMLLPAKHPITESLVRYLHLQNLHIGQRVTITTKRRPLAGYTYYQLGTPPDVSSPNSQSTNKPTLLRKTTDSREQQQQRLPERNNVTGQLDVSTDNAEVTIRRTGINGSPKNPPVWH